jgi:ribosome recycling factor
MYSKFGDDVKAMRANKIHWDRVNRREKTPKKVKAKLPDIRQESRRQVANFLTQHLEEQDQELREYMQDSESCDW